MASAASTLPRAARVFRAHDGASMADAVGDECRQQLVQRYIVFCRGTLGLFHHMIGYSERIGAHVGCLLLVNSAMKSPALVTDMPNALTAGCRKCLSLLTINVAPIARAHSM
jgi:hypothetical protein